MLRILCWCAEHSLKEYTWERKMKLRKYVVVILFMAIFIHCQLLVQAEYREIQFGEYPQTYVDPEKEPDLKDELYDRWRNANDDSDIVEYNGNRYLHTDSGFYKYEPITWIIISGDENRATVISKYVLDNHSYGEIDTMCVSWDQADLRRWCNSEFKERAFTKEEQAILQTINAVSCDWNEEGAMVTQEKVTIPSHEMAEGLSETVRLGWSTDYSGEEEHSYYTRCTGSYYGVWNYPIWITADGESNASYPANWSNGIRPCIVLNLAKAEEVEKKKEESKTKDLQNANISLSQTSYKFNGNKQTPSVKVTYGSKKLTSGSDYTVAYKNNRYVGTAEVQIKGTGSYTGTVTKKFKIVSPGSVTIKFDKNTKSRTAKVSKSSIKVSRGMQYGKLPTATLKGYKFAGWYTAKKNGKKIESKSYVENNPAKTLYAGWKRVTYKIQYNCDGGKNAKANPASYTIASKKITLQKPSRTGYIFAGWYNAKGKKVSAIPAGSTGDITLKAKWTPIKYKVSFKNSNTRFEKAMSDMTMIYGKKYTLPKNSYKSQNKNMVFIGWNTRKDGNGTAFQNQEKVWNLTAKNNGTVILYAQFANKKYSINYNLAGGSWNGTKGKTSYTCIDKKYTLPKPVKYDSNDGSGKKESMNCQYGKEYFINASKFTSEEVYTWNTKKDGSGHSFSVGEKVSNLTDKNNDVIILYAQWIDSNITCKEFISNTSHATYIDGRIRKYLSDSRVKASLNEGLSIILMFEGGSDNYNESKPSYSLGKRTPRNQAVVIVIQKISGQGKIVYWDENCSSLPDDPQNISIRDCSGNTTIYDGIYSVYRTIHSNYNALNVRDMNGNGAFDGFYISTDAPEGKTAACSGINIHTRTSYNTSGSNNAWSEGCQLVGNVASFKKFMSIFSTSGNKVGIYIVDRQLAKTGMKALYGNETAIEKLTSWSK